MNNYNYFDAFNERFFNDMSESNMNSAMQSAMMNGNSNMNNVGSGLMNSGTNSNSNNMNNMTNSNSQNNANNNLNNGSNSNVMLYGPYEGYVKGNLFRNLYDQYKSYRPMSLAPSSEREEALLNLNQIQFAMHELNLYLDVYPNDANIMRQFVAYRNTYNDLLNQYENRYGALNVNSTSLNSVPFGWVDQTWPWERSAN